MGTSGVKGDVEMALVRRSRSMEHSILVPPHQTYSASLVNSSPRNRHSQNRVKTWQSEVSKGGERGGTHINVTEPTKLPAPSRVSQNYCPFACMPIFDFVS